MTCEKAREKLFAAESDRDLAQHLLECASCAREQADFARVMVALRSLRHDPVPGNLLPSIREAVQSRKMPRLRSRRIPRWAAVAAASAACVALVVGVVLVASRRSSPIPAVPAKLEAARKAVYVVESPTGPRSGFAIGRDGLIMTTHSGFHPGQRVNIKDSAGSRHSATVATVSTDTGTAVLHLDKAGASIDPSSARAPKANQRVWFVLSDRVRPARVVQASEKTGSVSFDVSPEESWWGAPVVDDDGQLVAMIGGRTRVIVATGVLRVADETRRVWIPIQIGNPKKR